MSQRGNSDTIEEAFAWIVEWCDSHDHHFHLLTVGNASRPEHRFVAEVTHSGVGAVAPTVSRFAADPLSAASALATSLEPS